MAVSTRRETIDALLIKAQKKGQTRKCLGVVAALNEVVESGAGAFL
jgi:hypothetical protein